MADGKFRSLSGASRVVEQGLLALVTASGALWALEVHRWLPRAIYKEQFLGLFVGLALGATFLATRAGHRAPPDRVPWYDWLLAAGGLAVGLYVAVLYPSIAYQLAVLSPDKVGLGALTVLLVLEAARRLVGWIMVGLGAVFILYARFAWLAPGALEGKEFSWERIVVYLYLDTNGMLGLPVAVTATVVVAFILFGQLLYATGGDRFLTDIALVMMGRFRGGPAKVSVVASSLFGTVSGSAVSNVVVDGPITIPMMKRAGYQPHVAAAIEAVASTGGQIMPPVMGIAAFLIAEFLAIPYAEVALAAVIPAGLYYVALFAQVDLEAARHGLTGLPRSDLPRAGAVLRHGWGFVVPLAVLFYTLMLAAWEPGRAGMAAVVATAAVGAARRLDRLTPARLGAAMVEAGRVILDIAAITAVAGFVIGVLHLSGLAFKLSALLVNLAGGSSLALLVMSALVCILLGMGMPTAIVYVMLAVLVGPALAQLGVAPLGAHLFLLYFGMLSMITPPVCLATFAAASIGGADFMRTGWAGMRLGIVAYVVPFVFAYHPALLMQGTAGAILLATATAVIGVVLLSFGCTGWLFGPLGPGRRLWAIAAGLTLIVPPASGALVAANLAGLALGAGLVALEWRAHPRAAARPSPAPPPERE